MKISQFIKGYFTGIFVIASIQVIIYLIEGLLK